MWRMTFTGSCQYPVFNYQWGPSCCWAIRPLYRCKQRYNRLRSIYNINMDMITCQIRRVKSWYSLFIALFYCHAMTSDSDDEDSDSGNSKYQFSTPKGLHLSRKILWPLHPHDDQLEGICKMINGINLMVLTHTGSGKTGYFTMYMLRVRHGYTAGWDFPYRTRTRKQNPRYINYKNYYYYYIITTNMRGDTMRWLLSENIYK